MNFILKKITSVLNAFFKSKKTEERAKTPSRHYKQRPFSDKQVVNKTPPLVSPMMSEKPVQKGEVAEPHERKPSVELKADKTEKIRPNEKPFALQIPKAATTSGDVPVADYDTQFIQATSKKTSDIIIGFDLGTALTKVVLRDPWSRRAYAVPFFNTSNPKSSNYLLPTRLAIDSANGFYVPKLTEPDHISNLKLNLIDDHTKTVYSDSAVGVSISAFAATSIYIACVLRYARQWFFMNCKDIYLTNRINWQLNLGIPSKNYDELSVKELFEKCALWGWWLSVQKGPISVSLPRNITEQIHKATFEAGIHSDYINVFPEVAAEVVGYARSPQRDSGLHLLIDVGASTLDVSTFVLQGEGQQQYAFLSTDVERLGAHELHLMRLQKISEFLMDTIYSTEWEKVCDRLCDSTLPVPLTLEEYRTLLPRSEGEQILKKLAQFEVELSDMTGRVIRKVVHVTKQKRDPNSSRWKEGLPVFICGGGRSLDFYRDVIKDSEKSLKMTGCECFKILDLPRPEELFAKGLIPNDYHRIAVAYGLSFPYEDIGTIIPPSEIEDIIPERPIRKVDYISKDMV